MKKFGTATTNLFVFLFALTLLSLGACTQENSGEPKSQTPPAGSTGAVPPSSVNATGTPNAQTRQSTEAEQAVQPQQSAPANANGTLGGQPAQTGQADNDGVPAGAGNSMSNSTSQSQGMENSGQNALLHRNFLLLTANGKSFEDKEKRPNLEFNEGFRIAGGICNRFTGMAELKDGVLTAKQLASTKMFCTDQDLNELEADFGRLLEGGAKLEFSGNRLTLDGKAGDKDLKLVYELRDLVQ